MKNKQSIPDPQYTFILFFIVILTFVIFAPALKSNFVNWDDPILILDNQLVHDFSLTNIRQMFTNYYFANYHPLTILHFSIEHHFFGLNPFPYHLTNILLHILNTILVFIFICRLSGRPHVALIVSLFFAIHPLRVESVAWVTERKDVLFAFFYLLGLIQYLRYLAVHRKVKKCIIFTFLCFLLSLLAKPSAISFPLTLLLLDYIKSRRMTYLSISEKIPFFVGAFLFGVIGILGYYTPTNGTYPIVSTFIGVFNQTIIPLEEIKLGEEIFSFPERFLITCHALILYIIKTIYIGHLSPYYPLPKKINGYLPADYFIAFLLILLIVWLLFRCKNKTIRFGFLFFAATIFFNLPITRVSSAEIADRYTYIPHIGLFYLLAISFENSYQFLKLKIPRMNIILKALFSFLIIVFSVNTFIYAHTWKNSEQLWSVVVKRYPEHIKGYFNRGGYYLENKNYRSALNDYLAVLSIEPNDHKTLNNIGNCFLHLGNPDLALKSYNRVLEIKPNDAIALQNKAAVVKLLK